MASEKTPANKRIKRAEQGRDDWKVKALERREENEKLRNLLKAANQNAEKLSKEKEELQVRLKETVEKLTITEKEIGQLKKKPLR